MDESNKETEGAVVSETSGASQPQDAVPQNETVKDSAPNETSQIIVNPVETGEHEDLNSLTNTTTAQVESITAQTETLTVEAEAITAQTETIKAQGETITAQTDAESGQIDSATKTKTDEIQTKVGQSVTDPEECTTEKVETQPEMTDKTETANSSETADPSRAPQIQLQPEVSLPADLPTENISAATTTAEADTSAASTAVADTSAASTTVADTSAASTTVADTSAASTTVADTSPVVDDVVSASNLAPPPTASRERRGSTEKKSNFLRQFRSTSSASGFRKFTASQFMEVWNHYDTDGNGFIEDHELDGFLREFVLSSVGEGQQRSEILSEAAMVIFKQTFMDAFDENQDGMIDIAELAEILPTDENFLLLFHLKNPLESSVEFMRIWREYDKNCKGYIESKELKSFLKHILDNQKTSVSDEKLEEYTETILNLFDANRDGKLQLSEMARLMPVKQNILSKPILKGASCITRSDIDRLFRIYDQNRNGTIEDEELSGMLKDLMDLGKKDYTLSDIEDLRKVIMEHWDLDHDGTISKSELRMFLIQQCKMSAESQGIPYEDDGDDDDDDFD